MDMKKVIFFSVVVCIASSQALYAQWWTFEHRTYYEPLIAAVRDPHVSALALAWATRMEFMIDQKSPHRVWDIDLGAELPVVGWETARPGGSGQLGPDEYGIGIWIPIDFHMIEDFVDESAPILNTDYRFGVMVKAQHALSERSSVAARLHLGHESTHLGDEFSIKGQAKFHDFERINVSWEYVDLGVLYERRGRLGWNLRGGVTATLPFHDTYYTTGPGSITQSGKGSVTESKNWFDPYFGAELEWTKRIHKRPYDFYLSSELRLRTVYDYHKADPNESEERQASINLIAGARKGGAGTALGRVSPFIRFYHGVNPHGQFRNQDDYNEFGIGLRLVR